VIERVLFRLAQFRLALLARPDFRFQIRYVDFLRVAFSFLLLFRRLLMEFFKLFIHLLARLFAFALFLFLAVLFHGFLYFSVLRYFLEDKRQQFYYQNEQQNYEKDAQQFYPPRRTVRHLYGRRNRVHDVDRAGHRGYHLVNPVLVKRQLNDIEVQEHAFIGSVRLPFGILVRT